VTEPCRPTFQRRKLGAKLRRLREQAGHTLDEAAPMLDKTRSALQRVESGETKADVHLVRSMMDVYDCYDPGLLDEVREAVKPPWFRAFGLKNLGYVDVETEAARVCEFSVIVVPGLLQTRDYMRELFELGPQQTQREVNNAVAVRSIRQRRLTDDDRPLHLRAVVDEAALYRRIGGPKVMREQLKYLVSMTSLPTVELQVIPLSVGTHHALDGAFILLDFPDPEDPELLYVEYPTGSVHIEDLRKVREAKLVFDQLVTDALSPDDSAALIERVATELYGP
jgi:hypothetical protein